MPGAFSEAAYDLGGGLSLAAPISARDAEHLASAFAAMDPWVRYPYPAAALAGYLAADEPGAPRFGIYVDGGLQGALGLRREWLRGPYLQFIGLLEGAQGRGLGGACLAWMDAEARAARIRNIWVAASDFNTGAIRLYERAGFTRVAGLPDLVAEGRAEILFRKQLR